MSVYETTMRIVKEALMSRGYSEGEAEVFVIKLQAKEFADIPLWSITFGKFKGMDVRDINTGYLSWLVSQDWFHNKFADKVPIVAAVLQGRCEKGG